MGRTQPCVQAFSRTVPVWKPGCGRQAWCVSHERRYVLGPQVRCASGRPGSGGALLVPGPSTPLPAALRLMPKLFPPWRAAHRRSIAAQWALQGGGDSGRVL